MAELSSRTRDSLIVAIASGLTALLKAAAADDVNDTERATLRTMAGAIGTVVEAALQEMGL